MEPGNDSFGQVSGYVAQLYTSSSPDIWQYFHQFLKKMAGQLSESDVL